MHCGGFDVIIGNPPYKPLKDVTQYQVKGYECEATGNLYAVMLERSMTLCRGHGRLGFIVPVSSISTDRYERLQDKLSRCSLHYSSFDDRPSRLFDGLEHSRLAIHLIAPCTSSPVSYATRYNKWRAVERRHLFDGLRYFRAIGSRLVTHALPKLCSRTELGILGRLEKESRMLAYFYARGGLHCVYYSRKLGYFLQVLDFEPCVRDGAGNRRPPSEFKTRRFGSKAHAKCALCLLNSNLFYWFVTVFSDCRHVNAREVDAFPDRFGTLSKQQRG